MALFSLDTMSQAGSWQELSAGFRWQVPARFNLGWDCRSSTAFVTPVPAAPIAVWREGDPVVFLEYWRNGEATLAKFRSDWGSQGTWLPRR
jgi:hypothetical protein